MMKTRFNVLAISMVLAVLSLSILFASTPASQATPYTEATMPPQQIDVVAPPQHQAGSYSGPHVESVREQPDPHASDRYLVWTERERSRQPEVNDLRDSYDIMAKDLQTGQVMVVSDAQGRQMGAAVSGSTVVWMDMSSSCPTCQADILGKDLATGKTFTVAATSADESHPAIAGDNVAWIELDGHSISLKLKNLVSNKVKQVAVEPLKHQVSFYRPVVSNNYLVWAQSNEADSNLDRSRKQLYAYDINKESVIAVVQGSASTEYALDGEQLVWTDGQLHLSNLSTGKSEVLVQNDVVSPYILGNSVVWSQVNDNTGKLDIWGLSAMIPKN